MGLGRVCSIHNEWCADGACRWCEPLPVAPEWRPYRVSGQEIQQQTASAAFWQTSLGAGNSANMQQVQSAMDECWATLGRVNQQVQQQSGLEVWLPTPCVGCWKLGIQCVCPP